MIAECIQRLRARILVVIWPAYFVTIIYISIYCAQRQSSVVSLISSLVMQIRSVYQRDILLLTYGNPGVGVCIYQFSIKVMSNVMCK